jgi:hypothetical protein
MFCPSLNVSGRRKAMKERTIKKALLEVIEENVGARLTAKEWWIKFSGRAENTEFHYQQMRDCLSLLSGATYGHWLKKDKTGKLTTYWVDEYTEPKAVPAKKLYEKRIKATQDPVPPLDLLTIGRALDAFVADLKEKVLDMSEEISELQSRLTKGEKNWQVKELEYLQRIKDLNTKLHDQGIEATGFSFAEVARIVGKGGQNGKA